MGSHRERKQPQQGGPSRDPLGSVSSSLANLTRPELYSIYDSGVVLESEGIQDVNEAKYRSATAGVGPQTLRPRGKIDATTLVVLALSGIVYHELARMMHDNHKLHEDIISRPLLVGVHFLDWAVGGSLGISIPTWVGYALEGVLFGLSVPVLDRYLPESRITGTGGSGTSPRGDSLFSVLRTVNSMLGITFGIRKIKWASSMQASVAWLSLNFMLWLLLDSTVPLLLHSATLGCLVSALSSQGAGPAVHLPEVLYLFDFYFLGFLVFGKLGRYLTYRHGYTH
ncbi:Nsg2p KNAG_0F01510 [Huiozyma naganishii CBS 8797]|uniref:Protein NSG2 n=1 Tax=Huiozyma naganishii (strain ATCC MYA-139 / BCRC 22969 / CBS 8797 / KCTC 17520 / NBRC 10181 / NCYC 3082 / Yp74L-3) TaxID=1071383 RepID=J7S777_HUIN7|nr:hypothetical protein KNAG_0F01510 [Kazachstania naganishii CBS 8797]CCK70819.1 hypothetical protein KNAG_0F01510 [Kazachstania naganishii CBS 8797]